MAGWLSGFRAQTGHVACDVIRCLGEAAAPGGGGGGIAGPAPPFGITTLGHVIFQKSTDLKIHPVPRGYESGLTIRKHRGDGNGILTSSPFKIKLEEKQTGEDDKADQQGKRKETRGKNCLCEPQKTKRHNARQTRLQSTAQVGPKVDRPKGTECLIGGESFNEDWIRCNFCTNCNHENCSDTERNPLFYINMIY